MRHGEGLFHLHVGWISRAENRDVVAAAAYRSASRLANERKGGVSDFTHKAERTLYSELVVPPGSPKWATDRARLWNAVEAAERRKDARLATEIEFAIPYGVPRNEWEQLARRMAALYAEDGHVVDFSLHLGEDGTNPHVHMLLPMRRLTEDGFAKQKNRDMDKRGFIEQARKRWQDEANKWLSVAGSRERIDRRSYKERGLEREPGRHWRPDPETRAAKRDIHYRHRQEMAMQRTPTADERRLYPNLTQREEWPPRTLHPTHDMSEPERQELDQYRENLREREDREDAPTVQLTEPKPLDEFIKELDEDLATSREVPAERQPDRDRDADGREIAFQMTERELRKEALEREALEREQYDDHREDLRQRALAQMFYTREESERLKAAREIDKHHEGIEYAKIIADRMARLEEQDREKRNREVDRQQEEFLREQRKRDDRER